MQIDKAEMDPKSSNCIFKCLIFSEGNISIHNNMTQTRTNTRIIAHVPIYMFINQFLFPLRGSILSVKNLVKEGQCDILDKERRSMFIEKGNVKSKRNNICFIAVLSSFEQHIWYLCAK